MKSVSFQGVQLSAGQRRTLALRQQVRRQFLAPELEESVQLALRRAEEQGDDRKFRLESVSRGTPWVGDCFGF